MVDIHSHVLWGLDDGSESLEESVAMLKLAAGCGTTDIVASPHASYNYAFDRNLVAERIEQLSAMAGARPRIHPGCDFHLSFENVQEALGNSAKFLINNGPYLLVEFPELPPAATDGILGKLLDRGLIPIVTHPERNSYLSRIPVELLAWVKKGCLVQVTAQSLLGRFGKTAQRSAWEMIRRGIAHVIASDAHDTEDRPPRLDQAYEAVSAKIGQERARALTLENPRSVILGDPVFAEAPKGRRWFFWR